MARIDVRYLAQRPGRPGELPRWFWQPGPTLRAEGWRSERVPPDWATYRDAASLEAAAIARARELNARLDAVRTNRAIAAVAAVQPALRTLGQMIEAFRASPEFAGLQETTRRGYRQCLAKLEAWGADAPVRAIDATRIKRLREGLSATPAYANAVVRVLRLLLEWGVGEGWLVHNPALRPGLTGTEPTGLVWPREAVAQFVTVADRLGHSSMGTAVLLNEWLGQRQADVIRMPRRVLINGEDLLIRQRKTGAGLRLPVGMVAALKARLVEELARHAEREGKPGAIPATTIIVSEETGRAYLPDNFRHVFARVRAKLAETVPHFEIEHLMPGRDMADPDAFRVATGDLTFMSLRHTAVTRLAEAGCDAGLISAITGHAQATVHALMERYMVRTAKLARLAFQRRLDAEGPPTANDQEESG